MNETINATAPTDEDLLLFTEQSPDRATFKSECPPDKKIKVEDLFKFKRGRGDLHVSIAALAIALFFFAFFWTQTGWQARKLPDDMLAYLGYQIGLVEIDGRVTRFGRILKQSWVAPALCMLVLVPAALLNFRHSLASHRWRKRFMQPVNASFEFSKYAAALEYVAYFIAYTLTVPMLGYLLSTLILGSFLTWRLGYRTVRWTLIGLASGFATVVVFRSLLQIKTPPSIWLYDQLPTTIRAFMLTYF